MKTMIHVAAVLAALVTPAYAQLSTIDHSAHHVAQAQAAPLTDGEVRKVDTDARKITIRHGPIVNLDMPGMTMVFQVKEPAMLDKVKTGDKIKFRAEKAGGSYIVTQIEPAK
jgi:Cu(I)/Ag(I) efflux system protein CusF